MGRDSVTMMLKVQEGLEEMMKLNIVRDSLRITLDFCYNTTNADMVLKTMTGLLDVSQTKRWKLIFKNVKCTAHKDIDMMYNVVITDKDEYGLTISLSKF